MHRKLVDASILATQRVEKSVWLCRTSCQTTFVDFCFFFFSNGAISFHMQYSLISHVSQWHVFCTPAGGYTYA